jgi:hypothetical protein
MQQVRRRREAAEAKGEGKAESAVPKTVAEVKQKVESVAEGLLANLSLGSGAGQAEQVSTR